MLFTNSKCWPSGGSRNRKQNVEGVWLKLLGLSSMFDPRCPSKSLSNQLLQDQYFNSTNRLRHHNSSDHTNPNKLINKWRLIVLLSFQSTNKDNFEFLFVCLLVQILLEILRSVTSSVFTSQNSWTNWCGGFYCERTGCRRWESLPVCCSWGWWCWTLKVEVFLFVFFFFVNHIKYH